MDDASLTFLIARCVAALDGVQHRRARPKVERHVVTQSPLGWQRYDARHTALFNVRISDLLCLYVSGIARPVAEKASSLEDARQIRDMRYVVDAGHLPALFDR